MALALIQRMSIRRLLPQRSLGERCGRCRGKSIRRKESVMAHRRNRWLLFCLSISLLPTACNRAQRSPMREPSLEATLEGAPPAAASETVAKGDEAAEGADCSALGRRVTHCLGPAGVSVRIGPLRAV